MSPVTDPRTGARLPPPPADDACPTAVGRRPMRGLLPYVAGAFALVLADQASKFWAVGALTRAFSMPPAAQDLAAQLRRFWFAQHPAPARVVEVFISWWRYRYIENPGAAWGLLSRSDWPYRTHFFLAISALALIVMGMWLWCSPPRDALVRAALSMVLGGALGNIIDRSRLGYVIDFIDWHLGEGFHWPTFNVADAGISVGVILLVLDGLRPPNEGPKPPAVATSR